MKSNLLKTSFFALSAFLAFSCSSDDDSTDTPTDPLEFNKSAVIENYANLVLANYTDAMTDAQDLETAINTFVTDPTEANFEASKSAWLDARESYGTTEAFRFADGPIDSGDTEEIEGLLNSWPLDEAYIDYVAGDENAGIINHTEDFPTLTKELLASQNGEGGEENVSVGYHAIELLLWGQDLTDPSENLAGQREYTDYTTGINADRRGEYLALCADLLTDNLQVMIDQWSGDYKNTFLGLDDDVALDNMISSIAELSRSELAIERMAVALENQDQEDEHSCFSDNTHRDIRLNLEGILNVYSGSYGSVNGPSLEDLIADTDEALATELTSLLNAAVTAVDNTSIPFDLAIAEGPSSTEGAKVQAAVQALVSFGDKLLEGRVALGLN